MTLYAALPRMWRLTLFSRIARTKSSERCRGGLYVGESSQPWVYQAN